MVRGVLRPVDPMVVSPAPGSSELTSCQKVTGGHVPSASLSVVITSTFRYCSSRSSMHGSHPLELLTLFASTWFSWTHSVRLSASHGARPRASGRRVDGATCTSTCTSKPRPVFMVTVLHGMSSSKWFYPSSGLGFSSHRFHHGHWVA